LLRKQQKTLGGYFFLPHSVGVVAVVPPAAGFRDCQTESSFSDFFSRF